ncbi:DNase I-like protein, partial [Trametes sanguinea]
LANKTEVRVASLNINGFGNLVRDHPDNKWGKMYRMMQDNRIGILMLQETHLTEQRRKQLHRMFADRIKILHSDHPESPTTKEGVAFVINKRIISDKGAKLTVLVPGRACQLTIPWRGGDVRDLLCVYAPTSEGVAERRSFFRQVKQKYCARNALAKPHLMAGDFNVVEAPIDRYPVQQGAQDASVEDLDDLKREVGLMSVDGWRAVNPDKRDYTFQRGSGENVSLSRLDRIYVNRSMMQWMREWKIIVPGVKTDHALVTVLMTTPSAPATGKGRPVFPLHLLKNKILAKDMKRRGLEAVAEIERIKRDGRTETSNPQLVLSAMKRDWLDMARKLEKETVPKLIREMELLEAELEKAKAANGQDSEERRAKEILALTTQLSKMREKRIKDQQARSRAKHRVDGEIPSKYWIGLHKDKQPRTLIPGLQRTGERTNAGEQVLERDPTRMAALARAHYDGVQTDGPEINPEEVRQADIREVLKLVTERLAEPRVERLGAVIEKDECELALKCAKGGTAPGLDGIQYEVWSTLHARWKEDARHGTRTGFDVLELLTEVCLDVQKHGTCKKAGFTDGWMSPIYKEKGELTEIVNYRPITLLNTDYKIMAKVLAIRL